MVTLKCPNPNCQRTWNYTGKKTPPAYVSCPDCRTPVKLTEPKVKTHNA